MLSPTQSPQLDEKLLRETDHNALLCSALLRPLPIGDCENAPLPFSAASAFSHGIASPLPAVSESGKVKPPCPPKCLPIHPTVTMSVTMSVFGLKHRLENRMCSSCACFSLFYRSFYLFSLHAYICAK